MNKVTREIEMLDMLKNLNLTLIKSSLATALHILNLPTEKTDISPQYGAIAGPVIYLDGSVIYLVVS
jgi:hypothetical protein